MESEIYPHAPVSESGTIRKIKSKVPASFLFKHKRNLHLFCSNTDVTRFESRYRILKFLRHHENLKSAKNPYDTRVFSLCHPASFLFNYAILSVQKRCHLKNRGFPRFFSFFLRFPRFFKNRFSVKIKRCQSAKSTFRGDLNR